jgi:cardiolipin synthase
MVLVLDESSNDFVDALAAAAKRGVKVQVAGDMFTYNELSGRSIPFHYYSKRVRSATRTARKLSNAGVDFRWLGRVNVSTVSGRTHSKWCVIDDTVFSFGGVNLYKTALDNIDYMFRLHNPDLADYLVREQRHIIAADKNSFAYRSHSHALDSDSTALFDAGFFGDSIIYKRACKLAEKAESITLVSQYCPTGKLNKILKQKNASLYFNPWQKAGGFNRIVIRAGMALSKQTTHYSRDQYLHAKFILFTMKNGDEVAITGSHNFVHGGVLLGTKEVALETRDPSIIRQLHSFFDEYVA